MYNIIDYCGRVLMKKSTKESIKLLISISIFAGIVVSFFTGIFEILEIIFYN